MNIIIPLGGKGERFKNQGFNEPKALIKIFNKEMIFYVLDNLKISENDKVFIFYHHVLDDYDFKKIISTNYTNVILVPIKIQTRGAAETIKIGLDIILSKYKISEESCMLMDCDTFYTENIIDMYKNKKGNAVFYTKNYQTKPIFSYINMNDNNEIFEIKEKVKISDNANTRIYCFENIGQLLKYCNIVIDNNIKFNNEFYTSCVIAEMIKNDIKFVGIELLPKYIFNLGTPVQVKEYMNNCKMFLFDLDGTMILTDDIYIKVWEELLKDYNIYINNDLYFKYIHGNSDETVLRNLINNTSNLNTISQNKDTLFIKNLNLIKKVPGIDDFLDIIRKNGYKYSIVTNCNRIVAENIIKTCNFMPDYLIIGNECSNPKPYGDPYLKAIENYKTNSSQAFIFEDSFSGLISGSSINPKCIVGLETRYTSDELINYGANISIKDYENLNINELLKFKNINLDVIKNNILSSLKNSYNILDIKIYDEKLKGGFISDVIKVDIILDNKTLHCVLKLENKNETFLSKMANELGLYEREYYFYESISRFINIDAPYFYGLIKDDNFNNIGILMENQLEKNNFIGLNLNNESIEVSLKIIDNLAKFHSKFWNKNLSKSFPLLKKHNDSMFQPKWSNFINSKISTYKQKWLNVLTSDDIKKTDLIVATFTDIQNRLSTGNLTLCHGDVKAPNMFFTKSKDPIFIDWQYIAIGKGVQDLVFFMIESYDIDKINSYMDIFKNYYYVKLLEYGVNNYKKEDYEQDFKDAICYFPFFVAIWFGSLNEDELIDKNFPFFFIKKLYNFINKLI